MSEFDQVVCNYKGVQIIFHILVPVIKKTKLFLTEIQNTNPLLKGLLKSNTLWQASTLL